MLFLVLIVAFFVGASTTNAFMDDAFAGNHGNNGNNGCEKSGNSKSCESNPNSVTCESCDAEYEVQRLACNANLECLIDALNVHIACLQSIPDEVRTCDIPPPAAP